MGKSPRHHDITPAQCRAARAMLRLTQPELGRLAGLSRDVVVRLERGGGGLHYTTPGLIEAALASQGVTLILDEMGHGVRLNRNPPASQKVLAAEILTPAQCRAARGLLGLTVRNLEKLARVHKKQLLHTFEEETGLPSPPVLMRLRASSRCERGMVQERAFVCERTNENSRAGRERIRRLIMSAQGGPSLWSRPSSPWSQP